MSTKKGRLKKAYPTPISKNDNLVSTDEEKAEVVNDFFAFVFTGNLSP